MRQRFGAPLALTPDVDVQVGFPEVPPAAQSAFAAEVVAYAREQGPLDEVGWWSMDEPGAGLLGSRLLARGFSWGWRPNWMALDLDDLVDDQTVPADLAIAEVSPTDGDRLSELPYRPPAGAADEPSLTYFAAWRGRTGVGVGVVTLHCAELDGEPVGGIYSTSVLPSARRQGVGTALTVAACRRARDLGCRYVVLNATSMGEPVYRRTGFASLGETGQTWWMTGRALRAPAPPPAVVELVELIGDGDRTAVERSLRSAQVDLGEPLLCGLSPHEIATAVGQPDIAERLKAGIGD